MADAGLQPRASGDPVRSFNQTAVFESRHEIIMNAESTTFAPLPTATDLVAIRRQAEAMRAACLRALFRRIAAAFTRRGPATGGGLTATR